MKRRGRQGFTLVELLVVITIISMLMALLMPAVQAAREAGRRATCLNNQKNLALANLNYESSRRAFPGYVEFAGKRDATGKALDSAGVAFTADELASTTLNANDVSWVVMLYPYLERNDLWKEWSATTVAKGDEATSRPRVMLRLLVCPSSPPETQTQGSTPQGYVVNAGLSATYAAANSGWKKSTANGVFFNHGAAVNASSCISMSLDYLSQHDGSTYTVMLSENTQAKTWVPLDSNGKRRPIYEYDAGFVWAPEGPAACAEDMSTATYPVAVNDCLNTSQLNYGTARPSSRHGTGVVMSFCDGHQEFVRENIDVTVYRHIMTPDSKMSGITTGVFDPGSL